MKLSIIVPVYNGEEYLTRCVESLLGQTEKDCEILLIDDGSTDGSGKLCDAYSEKYGNIRTVHLKNGGVSNARNVGLAHCTGDYVGFVDCDDSVHPDMYGQMLEAARRENADIVQCNFIAAEDAKSEQVQVAQEDAVLPGGLEGVRYLYNPKLIHNSVCTKIFRRSTLGEIRFDTKLRIAEDFKFTFECCRRSGCICVSTVGGYIYYNRDDSVTHQKYSEKHLDCLKMNDWAMAQVGEDAGLQEEIRKLDLYQALQLFYTYAVQRGSREYLPLLQERIRNNPCGGQDLKNRVMKALIMRSVPVAAAAARLFFSAKNLVR